ncbi:protein LAZY 1-like [Vicia villosa]|uniref:protein LAZY 1-like n=1 Tax=Vicia villosa TaxID=3911 RepID=UPI00273CDC38|nr:protein LAZY 1-like [Vicia villosa]
MKLLDWIHRRLGQNSTRPSKHLLIAAAAVDEEEEQEAWKDGIFPGFLAIGTLGLDPSSTPTFSICVDDIITERDDDVTENELKLINDELEKVFALTNTNDDSSGRNSSGGRSSHGSISGESNTFCPLQGYLFGSAFELSATSMVAVSKNKEHQHQSERTSLAELFQRSKLEDENSLVGGKDDDTENNKEEAMKKKVKNRRMIHAFDSASADRKLHYKIFQMFHKKIHPVNPRATIKKKKSWAEYENKEQWIKTDADYLVLEL